MKARITVITIGVDDLERSLRFYRDGLGLKTEGIIGKEFEHGAVAFFDLQAGLKLAIWPRKSISHDSGLPLSRLSSTEFTLGHNVSSKAEVNAVMEQAKNAGAVIVIGDVAKYDKLRMTATGWGKFVNVETLRLRGGACWVDRTMGPGVRWRHFGGDRLRQGRAKQVSPAGDERQGNTGASLPARRKNLRPSGS